MLRSGLTPTHSTSFESEDQALTKVNQSNHICITTVKQNTLEGMLNSGSLLRLPWRFSDPMTEQTYHSKQGALVFDILLLDKFQPRAEPASPPQAPFFHQ